MAKNKIEVRPKFYYDIKIETMLPAMITYRILAEDERQAIELIKNQSPVSIRHRLLGRKDLKIMVYLAGSNMLKFIKNLI